jgi:hypothetical protein
MSGTHTDKTDEHTSREEVRQSDSQRRDIVSGHKTELVVTRQMKHVTRRRQTELHHRAFERQMSGTHTDKTDEHTSREEVRQSDSQTVRGGGREAPEWSGLVANVNRGLGPPD